MWSFVRRHVVMLFAYEPATGYEAAMAYGTSGPKPAIGYEPAFRGYVRRFGVHFCLLSGNVPVAPRELVAAHPRPQCDARLAHPFKIIILTKN